MNQKEYLSVAEIAAIFGKNEQTIREWASTGKIGAVKIGREWFFPKDKYLVILPKQCAFCENVITDLQTDFKDDLSRKEFFISGMCQTDQDKAFKDD